MRGFNHCQSCASRSRRIDAMPVSVVSDSTVSALCALAHVPGNELRFRPNVVVTLDSGAPFEEDEWVGSAIRIGVAVVRLDRRDSRCIIVNVDPAKRPARFAPAQGDRHRPGGPAPAFTERPCCQASSASAIRSSSKCDLRLSATWPSASTPNAAIPPALGRLSSRSPHVLIPLQDRQLISDV